MKKILGFIFLLCTYQPAQAADDFFYLLFTKCTYNQIDFAQSKEFKILSAPNLTIICAKNKETDRLNCKVMETESAKVLGEKEYEIEMHLQGMVQLTAKDHDMQKIVVQRDKKGAMYFFKEHLKIDQVRQTVCSGTFNDAKDAQKLIKSKTREESPIEKITPKSKKPTDSEAPAFIGE